MKGKLINYAYDTKKKDSLGVSVSNRGGWQSSSIDFTKDDLSFVLKLSGVVLLHSMLYFLDYSH